MSLRRAHDAVWRNQRGLSLVELLVGIGVFVLLFLMVDAVFISAHRTARKAELGADVQQNARIAIERLTREIRETDTSDIRIASDGSWVAFKSGRLPADNTVFCINVTSGPLYNSACNPTGDTFAPLWQRWIVYTAAAGSGELKREVQVLTPDPATPAGGQVIATSIRAFDARCPGSASPYLVDGQFCVRLEVEGNEVVQGSDVPPQQIVLSGRVDVRND